MATTTATTKKPAKSSIEKATGEASVRTLSRKVSILEDQVHALQDLADVRMEEAYARFAESRPKRPIPEIIYGPPRPCPCSCFDYQEEQANSAISLENVLWLSVGAIALVISLVNTGEKQNRRYE